MVTDFDEGRMLGELQELEDEINALTLACEYLAHYRLTDITKDLTAISRVIIKLEQDKERLESRLRIHRQKVHESGVKY